MSPQTHFPTSASSKEAVTNNPIKSSFRKTFSTIRAACSPKRKSKAGNRCPKVKQALPEVVVPNLHQPRSNLRHPPSPSPSPKAACRLCPSRTTTGISELRSPRSSFPIPPAVDRPCVSELVQPIAPSYADLAPPVFTVPDYTQEKGTEVPPAESISPYFQRAELSGGLEDALDEHERRTSTSSESTVAVLIVDRSRSSDALQDETETKPKPKGPIASTVTISSECTVTGGPLVRVPADTTKQGYAQPGFWRKDVYDVALRLIMSSSVLFLLWACLTALHEPQTKGSMWEASEESTREPSSSRSHRTAYASEEASKGSLH
ncbi:unnamed protein product [Mycena citricolor]|uniref:Uncharacterized protein n=1 Tax=Mycena citricolor TaxID=2018698 RepID=A0AAD2K0M2_9AGAR|nr:unnamed protein product [Mycena citricolor]